MTDCRPYVCPFPPAADHRRRDEWTCPNCAATYRLTRPIPWRPWRRWAAPHGTWRITWASARRLHQRGLYPGGPPIGPILLSVAALLVSLIALVIA